MNREIIDWLLEGPAWLRYAVELQLLEAKPGVGPVLKDGAITEIIRRLKDNQVGLPGLKTGKFHYTETGNAYWDLFFLADIGFTIGDLGLEKETETVLRLQAPDGSFTFGPRVLPNYLCMSAIIISSLAKMGYRDDPRLEKYIRVILDSQVSDGGWHCYDSYADMMDLESCPMDNMNILMLLGQYEKYREGRLLNRAIDSLLKHWDRKDVRHGFGVGRRFRSLGYPAVKYGILRVLDVLSLFPYAVNSQLFHSMLDCVRDKASGGKYHAEFTDGAYADFDFGQKEEPSRWLTFLIGRVEKRVNEQSKAPFTGTDDKDNAINRTVRRVK